MLVLSVLLLIFIRINHDKLIRSINTLYQGPRSNFEIGGGGGTVSNSILEGEGTTRLFLLTLYSSKNIEGHVPPPVPLASQSAATLVGKKET